MLFEKAFGILVMLGILSVLIIVHECGHFLVARFFGFQTPVFGLGLPFGPSISLGKRWNTEFRIHAAFLGGYVAIPELGDETNAAEDVFGIKLKPFKKFPIWQRALVAVAGVTFNVIFAYLLMLGLFYGLGKPTPQVQVSSLVAENPIAKNAGVLPQDQIKGVDDISIDRSQKLITYLGQHASQPVTLKVLRNGQMIQIPITPNAQGKVGMALGEKEEFRPVEGNPLQVAIQAGEELGIRTNAMLAGLGDMVTNIATAPIRALNRDDKSQANKPGLGDLHGVLAVVKVGGDMVSRDWTSLIMTTIMISMDLAVINLLPWPALDGGHLAFMTLEKLRGKPMEERAQGELVKWGFLSLLALMVVVMVNDVVAIATGKLDLPRKQDAINKNPDK
ncbi:MAG: site-2 protease family protein [Candidatus Melainabacteria bacterium]|nr:site-2 protease family protein [Candidatus Melainabacteria bacterium]MBX9673119.1 M50 family metallopeptidase [Candidatus Obscuribacterales bacterium]